MSETPPVFKNTHPDEEYLIGRQLGSGAFCEVRQATRKSNQEKTAIKFVEKKHCKNIKVIENEIKVLGRIQHPHIARMLDVYETTENLFIVMELVEGGDLETELFNDGAFSEEKTFKIFWQLLQALEYIHSRQITHRDLKLDNILFCRSTHNVKLTECGTPSYAAPEIIQGNPYNQSIDIWSLGVVLHLIGYSMEEIHDNVIGGQVEFSSDVSLSDEAKDLVLKMLQQKSEDRITIADIRNHPWVLKQRQGKGGTDEMAVASASSEIDLRTAVIV
ncbi:putative cAMP-dependent protein kinase catalytic subunit [Planoprotostelium fungivorum]|uniref:non-specific serine/threonine protein kinase n=1 Tax=Planoprotostelium fungivorum TaxID=1890364 RepID=A0A2P6NSA1_9EUKA|nr:putative cAMP-dependent protein kinase catalytic subunit [Planoprotostelium fungivorum]